MTRQIVFTGTVPEAEQIAALIPDMVAGTAADSYGVVRGIQLRAGVALLSEVQRAFLTKSRGGTGSDGIKWAPLAPQTIANRRTTRQERRALGIRKGWRRPSLDAIQDLRWRQIFARNYRLGLLDLPPAEAKRRAAAIAWATLKREGAKTLLEKLGSRQVDILRDTGLLFKSLSPGVDDRPSGADGQIFETPPGRVIVGTNQKPWHHKGNPAKNLPARPLWPPDGSIPQAWWPSIRRAILAGVVRAVVEAYQRG